MTTDLESRVAAIVADALNVPIDRVTPLASLIDDLGAESIDFIDILFRVESAFGVTIREHEMWAGSIDRTSQDTIDASVARLRERQPDFAWDRLPVPLKAADLPRLITVQTIVEHLRGRGLS